MIPALEGVIGIGMVAVAIGQAARQHPARTPWYARAYTVALGTSAMWLVFSVLLSVAPVLRGMQARVSLTASGVLHVAQVGEKVRNCQWLKSEPYVMDTAGIWYEASLAWADDRIANNSRPVGKQSFGVAEISFDPYVRPVEVKIVTTHSCGWMWRDTTTESGPWPIPP